MLQILLVSMLFVTHSYCQTPVNPCPGVNAPTYVDVVGCKKLPCQIVIGKTVEMYMNFTAHEFIDTLEAKVIADIGIPIPYPLPEPDACKVLTNTHCPLEINEPAQYKLEMPILPIFPEISLKLNLYLEANGIEGNRVVCCSIDLQVVKP